MAQTKGFARRVNNQELRKYRAIPMEPQNLLRPCVCGQLWGQWSEPPRGVGPWRATRTEGRPKEGCVPWTPELPNGHGVCQGGHEAGQVGETPTVPKWSYYKKQAQGRKPVPQHGKGTQGVGKV